MEFNGTKANNIWRLLTLGYSYMVPEFQIFTEDQLTDLKYSDIKHSNDKLYAVRSSGSISTPGRMKTMLNVKAEDLFDAVMEVHKSKFSHRVTEYLELIDYPIEKFKCDVIIMEMVNVSEDNSYSGVMTTLHPVHGTWDVYGELLPNRLGNNLMDGNVAGITLSGLSEIDVDLTYQLTNLAYELERKFDMGYIEIEFAIDQGQIWLLQIRKFDTVTEQDPVPNLGKPNYRGRPTNGLSCLGNITWDIDNVSDNSIFCTDDTEFESLKKLLKHNGILTSTGGSLPHASNLARTFHKPCIAGIENLEDLVEGTKVFFNKTGGIWLR